MGGGGGGGRYFTIFGGASAAENHTLKNLNIGLNRGVGGWGGGGGGRAPGAPPPPKTATEYCLGDVREGCVRGSPGQSTWFWVPTVAVYGL